MVPRLQAEGSEHVPMDLGRKSLRTLRHVPPLRKLIEELHPDIVHARSRLPVWMGWLALRGVRPRPPFVTPEHGLN